LEKLADAGEHQLASLRDGRVQVTTELMSGLLRLVDGLRTILASIEETATKGRESAMTTGALPLWWWSAI
jgi:two-component system chemotaxis sensor kinase CheA